MANVLLIMGSDSDLPIVEECESILKDFGISFETRVLSAHRTPNEAKEAISTAKDRGIKVIIGFAGLAAHLPGVIASHTTLPVIGVPINCGPLNGVDAMYSILQMPSGMPVATMAIGKAGSRNAALYAISILGTNNKDIDQKLLVYKENMRQNVLKKDEAVKNRKL